MKRCTICQKDKLLDEFHKCKNGNQGRHSYCKLCMNNYVSNWQKENPDKEYLRYNYWNISELDRQKIRDNQNRIQNEKRIIVNAYKTKCQYCSETFVDCLVFHHREPNEKDDEISTMISKGKSVKLILEEIEKCDIVCCNCHAKIHSNKIDFPLE